MEEKIRKIQAGDKEILNEFLNDNLNYIYGITARYYGIFDDYDELIQVALYAFTKSLYKYNFDCNLYNKHSKRWICSYVERYMLKNIDRVNNIDNRYNIAVKVYENCKKYYNHTPNVKELSKYGLIKADLAQYILDIIDDPYKFINIGYEDIYMDTYNEDDFIRNIEKENFIDDVLSTNLTEKQRNSIMYKFGFVDGFCYGPTDTSKIIGVSRQNVDDMNDRAIKRLKKKLGVIKK